MIISHSSASSNEEYSPFSDAVIAEDFGCVGESVSKGEDVSSKKIPLSDLPIEVLLAEIAEFDEDAGFVANSISAFL